MKWDTTAGINAEKPRGFAISPDGETAYAAMFDANSGAPSVQKFVQGPVAIEKLAGEVPRTITLEQNYPNPFNPTTTIQFSLSETGHASLRVFDALGREVSTLVNEVLTPGRYTATFDASSLSSGTYLYVLTAGGKRMSGSMVLAK